ncbi:MAG: MnhB domain-containing protein [Alphaproteobacteria bacterium]
MRAASFAVLRAAGRFYVPLIIVFALSLLATRGAGGGVGLIAGLVLALALALHALVFGADAARAASPGPALRTLLGVGLVAVLAGVGAPRLPFAAQVVEAGLFLLTTATLSLFITALAGRAPTITAEDW